MENTGLTNKYTEIVSVLCLNFKGEINLARIRFMGLFILALCKVKSVNYDRLASGFDSKAGKDSSYRRIQRFMGGFDLPMKLVSCFIFNLLPVKEQLVLVLDRTNWKFGDKNINILMLGVSYNGVAIPLMFRMLDKRGNSNTRERIGLVQQYLDWFGAGTIDCLLADREFVGDDWLGFLNDNNIRYYIRIRNNFKVYSYKKQKYVTAFWLFNQLSVNEFRHYRRIVGLHGQKCYLSGCKTSAGDGKTGFLIIVSFNEPEQAAAYYKQRWQVETLFKALKTSGFDMEKTHVTDLKRLERLLLLVMIALVWCYKTGDYIDTYVKKIKIKTHKRRAVSVFKYGLDFLSKELLSNIKSSKFNIFQFLSCT